MTLSKLSRLYFYCFTYFFMHFSTDLSTVRFFSFNPIKNPLLSTEYCFMRAFWLKIYHIKPRTIRPAFIAPSPAKHASIIFFENAPRSGPQWAGAIIASAPSRALHTSGVPHCFRGLFSPLWTIMCVHGTRLVPQTTNPSEHHGRFDIHTL